MIASVATALGVAAAAATPATAAPAPAPVLLLPVVKAVHSGKPTWVKAFWGATGNICDAQVTVRVGHTEVLYPSNTAPFTSFYEGDTLAKGATDYTAFRVTTTADHTLVRAMHLVIAYRAATTQAGGGLLCTGPVRTRTFYASLPVRSH
jgi:hypothetical protein